MSMNFDGVRFLNWRESGSEGSDLSGYCPARPFDETPPRM